MKPLIESNELNETLDLMITPMMLTNEAGTPVYLNRAFQSQIGYCIAGIPDRDSWFKKAYPDPDYRKMIAASWDDAAGFVPKEGHLSAKVISKICCADGVSRWFDVHQHTIGNKHAMTFLNIDEVKQHSDALKDIVQQNEMMLSIVAHDVRSPLSCIKQVVENYENINLSEQDVESLFSKMNTQVDHVFNILNSLLMRPGGNRGGFIAQPEPIGLKNFFSKYTGYYKERLLQHNVSMVLDLPEDAVLDYDTAILDVVCRNLLDNAIKYTDENGVICVSFKKTLDHAKIFIQDTGPGMSREQLERIIHNKESRKAHNRMTDGFGLGLILAKEILEKHHGSLSVKSEMGIGTSFIIDITDHSLN
jgi:signal transduction histidine kinase